MFVLQHIHRFELDWLKSSKIYISKISYIILFVNILSEQVSLVKGTPGFEKKTNLLNPLRDYMRHDAKWIDMVRSILYTQPLDTLPTAEQADSKPK